MTELGNEGNFKPKSSPEERGGEVIVGQDTWAEISAAKGESKTIATFDLLDCEAVSIIIEGTDGVRTAYIQDYSPDKNLESVDVLAKNLERLKLIPKTTVTVGIMIPELVYFEDETVQSLTNKCLLAFAPDVVIEVFSYKATEYGDGYDQGSLMIELGHDGQNNLGIKGLPDHIAELGHKSA